MNIRPAAAAADLPFLGQMLTEAAYWRPGEARPDSLLDEEVQRYVSDWGGPNDAGVIAEGEQRSPIGAAWFRLFPAEAPGYGFVDASIPEISMAVHANKRGRGVGTALLQALRTSDG